MERPASVIKAFVGLMLCILIGTSATAHPGSGIMIDEYGQIYFTDTGKGVWKIDTNGKLTYLPASKFHWMTIDAAGHFAGSPKNFGEYFERVTPQNNKPALIMCSDFPLSSVRTETSTMQIPGLVLQKLSGGHPGEKNQY